MRSILVTFLATLYLNCCGQEGSLTIQLRNGEELETDWYQLKLNTFFGSPSVTIGSIDGKDIPFKSILHMQGTRTESNTTVLLKGFEKRRAVYSLWKQEFYLTDSLELFSDHHLFSKKGAIPKLSEHSYYRVGGSEYKKLNYRNVYKDLKLRSGLNSDIKNAGSISALQILSALLGTMIMIDYAYGDVHLSAADFFQNEDRNLIFPAALLLSVPWILQGKKEKKVRSALVGTF